MTASEAKAVVVNLLNAKMLTLDAAQQVPVSTPLDIETFLTKHPIGELAVYYSGSKKQKPEPDYQVVRQNVDREVSIVIQVRKLLGEVMQPDEWIGFVEDAVSGYEVDCARADRKTHTIEDELLGEDVNLISYGITVIVPGEFIEEPYRNA
jgi:hypothetical protein